MPYGQIIGWVVNAVVALLLTLLGWVANDMRDSIEKLEGKHEQLPEKFVLKTDYHRDYQRILVELGHISDKIDSTARNTEADYNRRMDKMEANITDLLKARADR